MRRQIGIVILLGMLQAAALAAPVEFHVATGGSDRNPGTEARPFATLERARDAVRDLKKAGRAPKEGVTVWVHGGRHLRSRCFELSEVDSGAKDAPIVYRGRPGQDARLVGGRQVPASAFRPVTDPAVLARLDSAARGKVVAADLKALGITDYGVMSARGFRRPYVNPGLELFVDDAAMPLARWPNEGTVPIGKVLDRGAMPRNGDFSNRGGRFTYEGDRPNRWKQADDIWLSGLFAVGYADDTLRVASIDTEKREIQLAQAHLYGIMTGAAWRSYFALNLLEEIDAPGEWYLDRKRGMLYLYPQKPLSGASVWVSTLDAPLVALEGASHVTFRDLTFEVSRGMGVYIERGTGNRIAGCRLRNLGTVAVCIGQGIEPDPIYRHETTGKPVSRQLGSWHEHIYANTTFNRQAGTGHSVVGCDIYNTGAGGISLGGGDRKSLTPAGNAVLNCRIHHFNRLDRSYKAAVNIDGVGNRVAHCLIHDAPNNAIYVHGNDHLIEYNEIYRTVLDADDMGVVYMGRDPSEQGIVIRHNFFHDNGSPGGNHIGTMVLYFDDGACGARVFGNLFYRNVGRPVFVHGGNGHHIENNLFLETGDVSVSPGWDMKRWGTWIRDPLLTTRLREVLDITQPPYSTRYPHLPRILDDPATLKLGNTLARNIAYRCLGNFDQERNTNQGNLVTRTLPESDARALWTGAAFARQVPGFQALPLEKIGLYRDEFRATVPVAVPLFSPIGGGVRQGQTLSLVSLTPGATIRYTLDGSEPTPTSALYREPIALARPTTVRARAFAAEGKAASETVTQSYTVVVPGDPVRSTADGWLRASEARELKGVEVLGQGTMGRIENGDWASFGPFDFGVGGFAFLEAEVGIDPKHANQKMHVRLDSPEGPKVGTFVFTSTGGFQTFQAQRTPLSGLQGKHTIYLCFEGGSGIANILRFRFVPGTTP